MKKSSIKKTIISLFTCVASVFTFQTVNAEGTSNMIINNVQGDNVTTTYTYKISITDVSGAVKYTIDGKEGYAVFDAKGNATISVNSNSTLTLYDIPNGKSYTVEQTSKNAGYVTKVAGELKTKTSGTTSSNNSNITFTNSKEDGTSTDIKQDENKKQENPTTADPIVIALTALTVAVLGTIALRKMKVKRYE